MCCISQEKLGLKLEEPSVSTPEPRLHTLQEKLQIKPAGSAEWRGELTRGLAAMWDIAKSRLNKMGVE